MKWKHVIYLLTISLLFSCENTEKKAEGFSMYFDVDSLINVHQAKLLEMPLKVVKNASLQQQNDTTSYVIDSMKIAHELDVFRKANINKPANDGLYTKSSSTENGRNLITYTPVEQKNDLDVKVLKIYYNDMGITKLSAVVEEDHWIYNSERSLNINFNNILGKHTIEKFSVEGSQKIIFREKLHFKINGIILPSHDVIAQ